MHGPLVCGPHAGQRLGRHRVDGLVLGHPQRVFVAHQCLRVQFERLAHKLGNSVSSLAIASLA